MFSCFCQQDSQINVDRGWLEDTCKNVIALPFSKLQFTYRKLKNQTIPLSTPYAT